MVGVTSIGVPAGIPTMKTFLLMFIAVGIGVTGCSHLDNAEGEALRDGHLDEASSGTEGDPLDPGLGSPVGGTALHEAVEQGDVERTRRLLAEGVPVDVTTRYGWTALHFASERGFTELAELLLEAGTGVDAETRGGETAYHLAMEAGQTEVAELLVERGASTIPPRFPELRGEYFSQTGPGRTAEPFAFPMLASRHDHYVRSVTFSSDGREAYWPVIDLRDEYRRWIEGSRVEGDLWTKPTVAAFSERGYEDDVPSMSPGGNRLVFLSGRPLFQGDTATRENIWLVTREGPSWSDPIPLPGEVNSFGTLHQQVSLDLGDNLYFGVEGPGGQGSLDICLSRFSDGEWEKPVNLGPVVNGPEAEYAPSISPEGDYLIFTRNVDDGWTLFITFMTEAGSWTPPIGLGGVIEGVDGMDLSGAFITRDGKSLLFFGRSEGVVLPYRIGTSFIEELRAQALNTARGGSAQI